MKTYQLSLFVQENGRWFPSVRAVCKRRLSSSVLHAVNRFSLLCQPLRFRLGRFTVRLTATDSRQDVNVWVFHRRHTLVDSYIVNNPYNIIRFLSSLGSDGVERCAPSSFQFGGAYCDIAG